MRRIFGHNRFFCNRIVAMLMILNISCKDNMSVDQPKIDWEYLLVKYSRTNDSLKRNAVLYLKENIKNRISKEIIFYKKIWQSEYNVNLKNFNSDTALLYFMDQNNISFKFKEVQDANILSTKLIEDNIELSFKVK